MTRPARSVLRVLVATLLLSMALGASPATAAATRVADGLIAYTRIDPTTGRYVIRTVDPATGAHAWIAQGTSPAWSPNGRRLAFVWQPNATDGSIRIRNANGSLTFTGVAAQPAGIDSQRLAWSPDGTRLAYVHRDRIWVMNVARPHRPRAVSPGAGSLPSWAPGSGRIAYTAFDAATGEPEIHIVRADGTGDVNVTKTPFDAEYGADWSPNGRLFAFYSGSGEIGIYVSDVDGTDVEIRINTGDSTPPAWSPTGSRFAFVQDQIDGGPLVCLLAHPFGGGGGLCPVAGTRGALQLDWQPRIIA